MGSVLWQQGEAPCDCILIVSKEMQFNEPSQSVRQAEMFAGIYLELYLNSIPIYIAKSCFPSYSEEVLIINEACIKGRKKSQRWLKIILFPYTVQE